MPMPRPVPTPPPVPRPDRLEVVIADRLRAAGCVFAEEEARLLIAAAAEGPRLTALVNRRVAGLPLEHVLGWVDFCGLRIAVDPGVFVPRRRTQFLVRQAAAASAQPSDAAPGGPSPVVVDLCCGSGAVGVALATIVGGVRPHASDIDPVAVRCAERNLAPLGGRAYQGDLYDPLPVALRGRVDLLVANAPYVPTDAVQLLPPEARVHEPRIALDGGEDGLDLLRQVIAGAASWLAPRGRLLVESSRGQAARLVDFAADAGLTGRVASCPELAATVVIAVRRDQRHLLG